MKVHLVGDEAMSYWSTYGYGFPSGEIQYSSIGGLSTAAFTIATFDKNRDIRIPDLDYLLDRNMYFPIVAPSANRIFLMNKVGEYQYNFYLANTDRQINVRLQRQSRLPDNRFRIIFSDFDVKLAESWGDATLCLLEKIVGATTFQKLVYYGVRNRDECGDMFDAADRLTHYFPVTTSLYDSIFIGRYRTYYVQGGNLVGAGANDRGQLGIGGLIDSPYYAPIGIPNVVKVSCGDYHTLFLTVDGDVYACGSGDDMKNGMFDKTTTSTPVKIYSGIRDIACGANHSLLLEKVTGKVIGFGNNATYYPLSSSGIATPGTPFITIVERDASAISIGEFNSYFMIDGEFFGCGHGGFGQFGFDNLSPRSTITKVPNVPIGTTTIKTVGSLNYYIKPRAYVRQNPKCDTFVDYDGVRIQSDYLGKRVDVTDMYLDTDSGAFVSRDGGASFNNLDPDGVNRDLAL
jgi:hypothetical protein